MSMKKELEDSGSPTSSRYVEYAADGLWAIVTEHPILGVTNVDYGYHTQEDAEAILSGLTDVDPDVPSDTDIEIESTRDVKLKAMIDPSGKTNTIMLVEV